MSLWCHTIHRAYKAAIRATPYAPVLATVKLDDPDSQESGLLAEMPKVHVTFLMQLLEDCGNVKSGKVLLHPGRFNVDSRAG